MTSPQTKQMHQQADTLLNMNKLQEAHAVFDQICTMDNQDVEAFHMRGALDGEMGNVDSALQSLNAAIKIDPEYPDVYHTLAHLLQHQGKLSEASTALQKAVELDPEYLEAWTMLSGVQGELSDFNAAESSSRRALALDPSLMNARGNLANALVELENYEAALPELQQVTQQQPGNAHYWSLLGAVLGRLDRLEEALTPLETTIRLNPGDLETRTTLGHIYGKLENFTKAFEHLKLAITAAPDNEQTWSTLARVTGENDWKQVADFCEEIRSRFPANKNIIINLGYALEMQGDLDGALALYTRLCEDFPDWGDCWNRLGLLQMRFENEIEASTALKKALDCGVDSPLTLCMYGATLRRFSNFNDAEKYCLQALEKAPELIPVYVHLGIAQIMKGELDQALETLNKGRLLEHDNISVVAAIGDIYERKGEFEKSKNVLEPYLNSESDDVSQIVCIYAKVSNKLKCGEKALPYLDKVLKEGNSMRASTMDLHFRSADIYNTMKNCELAMEHYNKANALSALSFDREAHIKFIDDNIACFNAELFEKLSPLANHSARPIFIVGMPRSGTSLAEQILASHADVYGAGELMDFSGVALGLGFVNGEAENYKQLLNSLDANKVSQYANAYLKSIDGLANGEKYVSDKLPYNFLRLGLVQILFPNARIIHTRRDPMDTCLSCYFLDFMGTHPHAYGLEDLGIYYREYERLMAHWHKELTTPILDLQYEDVVNDIDAACHRIIDFCELEWDDSVLNFHQSKRVVRTASYDQVRRPIYNSSIGRWRPYEQWLEPLKKGLAG